MLSDYQILLSALWIGFSIVVSSSIIAAAWRYSVDADTDIEEGYLSINDKQYQLDRAREDREANKKDWE